MWIKCVQIVSGIYCSDWFWYANDYGMFNILYWLTENYNGYFNF